ncbi:MAG: hypothetical protein AABX44_00245 [Nanoarchaeota archaeon]
MKNLKNILAGGLFGISSFFFTQCSQDPHSVPKNSAPLTKEEINHVFGDLNPGLKEALYSSKVYFLKNEDFLEHLENKYLGGHTFYDALNKEINVCFPIGKDSLKNFKYVRAHESAHARNYYLDYFLNSNFSDEWKQIANFEYDLNKVTVLEESGICTFFWKDGASEPKYGLIKPYSATNIREDVANFVELIGRNSFLNPEDISYLFEGETKNEGILIKDYASSFPLHFADTTDHRYQKKLDLLKEYNFLTNEEHKKLTKDLGSLNYLLKK